MKYKIQIGKIEETEDRTNPEEPVQVTKVTFIIVGRGETHIIFTPGHNLSPGQIKKAIKDEVKMLPTKYELEGTTLEVDTEEAD